MESQALVTTDEARRLASTFDDERRQLAEWEAELREMKMGTLKAHLILERKRDVKAIRAMVENSEFHERKRNAYDLHRYLSRIENQVLKPCDLLDRYMDGELSDWEIERRRRVELERRKLQEEVDRQALEQRQAEIEHLQENGRADEAAAKAAAPIIPISVSVDSDAGKPDGVSMIEVWVPKRDEHGRFVFSDRKAYRQFIADHPEFDYLVEDQYGKVKQLLTANRGMIQLPGLEIERKFEPRTRMEADE